MSSLHHHVPAGATLRGIGTVVAGLAVSVHHAQPIGAQALRGEFTLLAKDQVDAAMATHLGDDVSHNAFVGVKNALFAGERGSFEAVRAALVQAVDADPERVAIVDDQLLSRRQWELVGPTASTSWTCDGCDAAYELGALRCELCRRVKAAASMKRPRPSSAPASPPLAAPVAVGDWRSVDVAARNSEEGFAPFGSIMCCATALCQAGSSYAHDDGARPPSSPLEVLAPSATYDFVLKTPNMGGLATVEAQASPAEVSAKVVLDLVMRWATPAEEGDAPSGGLRFKSVFYKRRRGYVVVRVPNNSEAPLDYDSYFVAKYEGESATPAGVYEAARDAAASAPAWAAATFTLDQKAYKYERETDLVQSGVVKSSVRGWKLKAKAKVKVTIDKTGATVKEVVEMFCYRSLRLPPPTIAFRRGAGYFVIVKDARIVSATFIGQQPSTAER